MLAQVAWTLALTLRNAIASGLFAWPILLCFSAGNVISGVAPAHQSHLSFAVATLLWSKLFNWLCVCLAHTALVVPRAARKATAASANNAPPKLARCWREVVRETLPAFVLSTALLGVVGVGLNLTSTSVRACKPAFYTAIGFFHVDTTASSLASTRFFLTHIGASPLRQHKRSYIRQLAHEALKLAWNAVAAVLAAVYTHAVQSIVLSTRVHVLAFTVASLAFKTALQEAAKVQVFKIKLQNPGVMAVLVGIPTILINTQMRITLLRAKSVKTALEGTVVMAVTEVALRFLKASWVRRQIRRRQDARRRPVAVSPVLPPPMASATRASSLAVAPLPQYPASSVAPRTSSRTGSAMEFTRWKRRVLHYHAAEIYVDMIAEYIALGCSYATLFLFWDHPQYLLRLQRSESLADAADASSSTAAALETFQPLLFAVQLGLEIVADYVACSLETWNGVDLTALQQHSMFIAVFLVWAVVGNTIMSANLLLRE